MAGSIINNNGSSSISVSNLIDQLQSVRRGMDEVSLTNYSTTAVPALASGSICEVAGSIYRFSSEEPISTTNVTSTANCTWYVELVPSSSTISARFSTVSPAWRDDYSGWYESTSLTYRMIAEMEKNGSSEYWYKNEFKYLDRDRKKNLTLGDLQSSVAAILTVSHYISNITSSANIRIKGLVSFSRGSTSGVYENTPDPSRPLYIGVYSTYILYMSTTALTLQYFYADIKYI